MHTLALPFSLAFAVTAAACSDASPEPPIDELADKIFVWKVERGDVATRASQLAALLGLTDVSTDGGTIRATGPAGVLETDYASARMHFTAAEPIPLGDGAPMNDNVAIDLAAAELHRLGLLPPATAACACAAGLGDGCTPPAAGRSPWKSCETLAVRIFGIPSDLVPPPSDQEAAETMSAPLPTVEPEPTLEPDELAPEVAEPAPVAMAGDPIDVAFTPRLPITRIDGVTTYAELIGGMADLQLRMDASGALLGFDARYQAAAAEPILADARTLDEVLAEKIALAEATGGEPPTGTDPAAWTLTFLARPLMNPTHHGPSGTTPLTFYYPMWARLSEGSNAPLDLATASDFLPRITAFDVPDRLGLGDPARPWIRFASDTGTGTPTVTWYVRDPDLGQVRLETTPAILDLEHPGEWVARMTVLPPEGEQQLTLEIADGAGYHYDLSGVTVQVDSSDQARGAGQVRTSHNMGMWSRCPGGGSLPSWCHTDGTKVVLVSIAGRPKSGPWGVRVQLARDLNLGPSWSTQFIRDLAIYQFHLDMKLKIPERKRDPVKGWAEDWPLAGDPDAQMAPDGSRFKEIWIRTDTCKLDSANAYICEVVPNGPAPRNPHRKMGVLCPKDRGHPLEAGTDNGSDCNTPVTVNNGFEITRIVTGMPGRLTLTQRYQVVHETVPIGISDWIFNGVDGTVLRLVNPNGGGFDATTTNRTNQMLQRLATPNPAVLPRLTWKWEGDRPRARPEDPKVYGGTGVECLNVLEFCRQANLYDDPRRYPWDHNAHRIRPPYPEATTEKMPRPWERGMPMGATPLRPVDRNEGDPYPYCPHELYRVLKERFCPCPDDGSPCQATGDPTRPNPSIEVLEVRLGAYLRMTPFENGNGGALLISELKGLPEAMLGMEGHMGAKMHSAIPRAAFLNNIANGTRRLSFWIGVLFPQVRLAAWATSAFITGTMVAADAFHDWIDIFHWYEWLDSMPIVRPTSRIPALGGVRGTRNSFYWNALGVWPNYTFPGPSSTFSWGDKSTWPRLFPQTEFLVPPAFHYQGFWQNIHFKSTSDTGSSILTQVVVPGCQSLWPVRRVVAGGWFWTWDRNLCVHHHETWTHLEPKQLENHDMAWMVGAMAGGLNPTRVGAVYPDTTVYTRTGTSARTRRLRFWEFTVTRTTGNATVTTFDTAFFFSQGPSTW